MAVEVLQDCQSPVTSPRISFSYNVPSDGSVPMEQCIRSSPSSSIDFDFGIFCKSFDEECSSADALFLNGMILPVDIKKRSSPPPPLLKPSPLRSHQKQNPRKLQLSRRKKHEESHHQELTKPPSSVCCFKRSTSLNCGSGCVRMFCPFPLLYRSNSTGSTATVKRSFLGNTCKKQPLKKRNDKNGCSGIHVFKIRPVLNMSSANMFGLGYIFSGGKDKSKKSRLS